MYVISLPVIQEDSHESVHIQQSHTLNMWSSSKKLCEKTSCETIENLTEKIFEDISHES